ncbi:MAG TPA: flagellar biosynthesis anti-sigma factor FlgM [Spirochaetota bacterium]|nr:flagellar biosynthesis anti-sigma factor FlgM [Spirochaetota bacterium]HOM38967.1 flagellar biosynthesis anti-sigma factor FlgM [Spirochaetota bacterium]HPQ48373.1 flagellar biosynthesis anti-sigma factor FlgM [Spirochaetota bacterium]
MEIRKIFQIFNNKTVKKNNVKTTNKTKTDSIHISDEAKLRAEVEKYKEVIKNTPDIRQDRIAQVKERLKSEYYNSSKIYNDIASKLSNFLDSEDI